MLDSTVDLQALADGGLISGEEADMLFEMVEMLEDLFAADEWAWPDLHCELCGEQFDTNDVQAYFDHAEAHSDWEWDEYLEGLAACLEQEPELDEIVRGTHPTFGLLRSESETSDPWESDIPSFFPSLRAMSTPFGTEHSHLD